MKKFAAALSLILYCIGIIGADAGDLCGNKSAIPKCRVSSGKLTIVVEADVEKNYEEERDSAIRDAELLVKLSIAKLTMNKECLRKICLDGSKPDFECLSINIENKKEYLSMQIKNIEWSIICDTPLMVRARAQFSMSTEGLRNGKTDDKTK